MAKLFMPTRSGRLAKLGIVEPFVSATPATLDFSKARDDTFAKPKLSHTYCWVPKSFIHTYLRIVR